MALSSLAEETLNGGAVSELTIIRLNIKGMFNAYLWRSLHAMMTGNTFHQVPSPVMICHQFSVSFLGVLWTQYQYMTRILSLDKC